MTVTFGGVVGVDTVITSMRRETVTDDLKSIYVDGSEYWKRSDNFLIHYLAFKY